MPQAANVAMLLLIFGLQSAAFARTSDARLCDQAALIAAQTSDTPFEVLQAISRVETGRSVAGETTPWPWAVNYAGKGYWFETESQAYDFANTLLSQGEDNFDIGCFQVNQHWHGNKFPSLKAALSPKGNAAVAAEYLKTLFDQSGDWGGAVAAYHSKTAANGEGYRTKVEAMLQHMRGAGPSVEPDQVAQVQPENSFPLLRQGSSAHGASLVPIDAGGTPLIDVGP